MEYIYKIENIINNKKYIGLTNNPARRKRRHFYDLEKGIHDNPHLQKAYNKYGKDNFIFEVLAEFDCSLEEIKEHEKEFIKKYDTYLNGYNCNPGGDLSYNFGQLTKEEVFEIKSVLDKLNRQGQRLADIYNVSVKVISNIKTEKSYNLYIDEYKKLPQEEKDRIFVLLNSKYNFIKPKQVSRRQYTREQVYIIYIYRDYKLPYLLKDICKDFNMNADNTAHAIKSGKIYKDYYEDYKKLNFNDKKKILCDYIEIYNKEPFELLENPNV